MNKSKQHLNSITILRFVAALYVFLFHANMRIALDMPSYISNIINNGAIGMSLFFVLSGFILTYNYDYDVGQNYFIKRIKIIYPAYIFCGVITLPILMASTDLSIHSLTKTFTTIALYITATQSWFYPSFSSWQFGGTWSISTEMFFYALFPILLKIANSKNLHFMAIIAFIATASIIPVSLVYTDGLMFTVYYATPIYRLPEFVMGIAAAKYMKLGFKVGHAPAIFIVIAIAYIASITNIGYMQYNFILVPLICLLLIYLSSHQPPRALFPLVHLGNISYSFYLMQVAGFMIFDHFHPAVIYKAGFVGWVTLFIIFNVMAQISYSLFEKRNLFEKLKSSFIK